MPNRVEVTNGREATKGALATRALRENPMQALRGQMDRLFDEFVGDWWPPALGRSLFERETVPTPLWSEGMLDVKFDISETDDEIELAAELPGLDEKDVELVFSDGILTLKGEKRAEAETKERDYYVSQRRYGSFARSMRLPESVDPEKIKARFSKGVLKVTLPKRPEAKARRKKIRISS